MKINIIRTILIILLLCTFWVIFGFSSQNSEESTGLSMKISRIIINIVFPNNTDIQKEEKAKSIEHTIRKLAHFSIYFVVGILLISLFLTYNLKNIDRYFLSQIIGIIYATSDEIHQSFTPGRSPQFTDVLIDNLGVFTGIIIILLLFKLIKYNKKAIK